MKNVLVLGGNQFPGCVLTERLVAENKYFIMLFDPEKSGRDKNERRIHGPAAAGSFRDISKQSWDAVIDFSTRDPRLLARILESLGGKVDRYIFVSCVSAYDNAALPVGEQVGEESWLKAKSNGQASLNGSACKGLSLAECERVLMKAGWLNKIILRPSLIYGRLDDTDVFYSLLYKIRQGECIVLPEEGKDTISLTYVKDLAKIITWAIHTRKVNKVYNVSTHPGLKLQALGKEMARVLGREFTCSKVETLLPRQKQQMCGKEFELWARGGHTYCNEKIRRDSGINFLDFEESLKRTVQWYSARNWPMPVPATAKVALNVKV